MKGVDRSGVLEAKTGGVGIGLVKTRKLLDQKLQ